VNGSYLAVVGMDVQFMGIIKAHIF